MATAPPAASGQERTIVMDGYRPLAASRENPSGMASGKQRVAVDGMVYLVIFCHAPG